MPDVAEDPASRVLAYAISVKDCVTCVLHDNCVPSCLYTGMCGGDDKTTKINVDLTLDIFKILSDQFTLHLNLLLFLIQLIIILSNIYIYNILF